MAASKSAALTASTASSTSALELSKKIKLELEEAAEYGITNQPALLENAFKQLAKECYELSKHFEEGTGGAAKDEKQRIEYLQQAADFGLAEAQYELGMHYHALSGSAFMVSDLSANLVKAFSYFKHSADQNHAAASLAVGSGYQFGQGVLVDTKKAKEYYILAAKLGYPLAFQMVGLIYEHGMFETDKHPLKAIEYYRAAALQTEDKESRMQGKFCCRRLTKELNPKKPKK